jgi:hypothetical protein
MFALLMKLPAKKEPQVPWDGEISYASAEGEPLAANA